MSEFREKYGPWAFVAGGALGIGEAYSRYAAAQGLNVVVLDRDQEALDKIGADLPKEFGVECLTCQVDLSADDLVDQVAAAVGDREIGLLVYNAAIADVGPFYKDYTTIDFEKMRIAVNCTGPLLLTHHFGKAMLRKRSGGIVLMSSNSGFGGSPYYSAYAATRAYCINLANSLWYEFKAYDVDVLGVAAGLTLSSAAEHMAHIDAAKLQTTDQVVEEAMSVLGSQPFLIPGEYNREERARLDAMPLTDRIADMAKHSVNNFLGGTPPEQVID